ncbi:hypothetical protein [Streptomyces sp. NBC_00102]|uniref:hypothetical protein n=1 Tax=Streptomyces sp. NBC_00102 TaxID=2975652 RepID=UPI00224D80D0|nr:hypothetical protein [Streptomyces sp. NBC_00102]MCX5399203.1 hypothetical protein [Streptomyces sp. NBC_00102]
MTDSQDLQDSQASPVRRKVAVLLMVTAVLLVPLLLGFWYSAEETVRNKSATDWQGNHEAKLALQRAALVLFGLPFLGAACGWIVASLRDRPAALPVARSLLTSTVLLWLILAGTVFTAFVRSPLF